MKGEGKVKKYEVVPFLKTKGSQDYVRIKKSTELKLDFGADTQKYDYISDENPTTELEKYKPEISGLPLTMYKEEPDFALIWDLAYNLKIGGDAVAELLLVYKFDEDAAKTGTWKSWNVPATVVVKTLDAVEGKIEFDLQMRGTIARGTVTESSGKPVFKEDGK